MEKRNNISNSIFKLTAFDDMPYEKLLKKFEGNKYLLINLLIKESKKILLEKTEPIIYSVDNVLSEVTNKLLNSKTIEDIFKKGEKEEER